MVGSESRVALLGWVRGQLLGPALEVAEGLLTGMRPLERYPCGVLFPVIQGETGLDAEEDDEAAEEDELAMGALKESEIPAEPARRRRYVPPSAAGFSFFICGSEIRLLVQASATVYELESDRDSGGRFERDKWRREPLVCSESEEDALVLLAPVERTSPLNQRILIFGGRAGVDATWRPFLGGWIVTISLFNKTKLEADQSSAEEWNLRCNSGALFEASLRCIIDAGEVGEYPRVDRSLLTEEERELELQYRSRKIFAIGHGCAADWKATDAGRVTELNTEFIPAVEVPLVTTESTHSDAATFELESLSKIGSAEEETERIVARLHAFVDGYVAWIAEQHDKAQGLDDAEAAGRITGRMDVALKRMHGGVGLLETDTDAAAAFGLANRAMAWQMRQGKPENTPRWRPFQLAFLLATIESTMNEDSPERDLVDLIWFPTGGGKTEAYLGLIAFLIAWRRRRFPGSGGGTTAIMRYTLRLLTAQQFERASRLICALELIRRMEPDAGLGDEPITLGMWVGGEASPNGYKVAQEAVAKARSRGGLPPPELILGECPWCGVSFSPERNFQATANSFEFICLNKHCEIQQSGGVVPCQVVDEALYEKPPTLLIATIDKFARLAWEPEAGAFFGRGGNRPPELVIQDELHLISGALGSIAGLYEAALNALLALRGVRPKYVASTATIRQASQQVQHLYGRDLAVFPPPGLDCDDSYFAKTNRKEPGRLYVGYYAPMLDRQHCLAPLAAALLAAPEAVFEPDAPERDYLLDAWWTMVVYHGSLRGVVTSHNAFGNDVKERLRRRHVEERLQALKDGLLSPEQGAITRTFRSLVQLTSNSGAADNARTFAQLRQKTKEDDCIDVVLATNMISVGLDVERLALMVVNGQPLTTGEYIQATSRVGRGKVPGLVFANYYRDQARSLSHYENFRPYHEAFYRFVEPTSVTPFTWQARNRALHAALVIVVRHGVKGMAGKSAAGRFRSDSPEIRCAIDALAARCAQACGGKTTELRCHIDELAAKWDDHTRLSKSNKRQLVYNENPNLRNADRLLHTHGDRVTGLWETMQSMRNVEQTALLIRL